MVASEIAEVEQYLKSQRILRYVAGTTPGLEFRGFREALVHAGVARYGSALVTDMIAWFPLILFVATLLLMPAGTRSAFVAPAAIFVGVAAFVSSGMAASRSRRYSSSDLRFLLSIGGLGLAVLYAIGWTAALSSDVWTTCKVALVLVPGAAVFLVLYLYMAFLPLAQVLSTLLAPTWLVWRLIFVVKDWFTLRITEPRLAGSNGRTALREEVHRIFGSRVLLLLLAAPLGTTLFAKSLGDFVHVVAPIRLVAAASLVWAILVIIVDHVSRELAREIWNEATTKSGSALDGASDARVPPFVSTILASASAETRATHLRATYFPDARLVRLLGMQLGARTCAVVASTALVSSALSVVLAYLVLAIGSHGSVSAQITDAALAMIIVATCTALAAGPALLSNAFVKSQHLSRFEGKAVAWRAAVLAYHVASGG